MQMGYSNDEEHVQDLQSIQALLALRDEFGVPEYYLECAYKEHELRSAADTSNYGWPLYDALTKRPVNPENVEALLAVRDNEGNPLLDFEVYHADFGLDQNGKKLKKNIIAALLQAEVEHNLKIEWLKQILNLRTMSGEININITHSKIKSLLPNEAALLNAEYSKVLLEESEKQVLVIRRQDAFTRISWIIKNGSLLELNSILSDKDKTGMPHAYAYYQQMHSNPGGPLGDALSALPPNQEVIQALLSVRDRDGYFLWGESLQPLSFEVPVIIQAARLHNLEYLGLMLALKNPDGSFVFDPNEIFEGRTTLDIVNESSNPETEKYAALIKNQDGVSYEALKELFFKNADALSPKTKDAIIAWEVRLTRFELLKEAYSITRNILSLSPFYEARINAINFLNATIEKLGRRKNYPLNELQHELGRLLNEFDELDRTIDSYNPAPYETSNPYKHELMRHLIDTTYHSYQSAQPKGRVKLLKEQFIERARKIENTSQAQIVTVFCELTQAKALAKRQEQQSLLVQGGIRFP